MVDCGCTFYSDLSCIIDKIVNLLFRFEKNIWKECEQDNILNLRSWFNTSVPWWNTAMSIWRLNSCKTQAWNDNSNTLILDTYNWPVKVLVKPHKLSCKTILKGRFRLIRTSGHKNPHTNSYNSAMSLISQDDHLTAGAWATCV